MTTKNLSNRNYFSKIICNQNTLDEEKEKIDNLPESFRFKSLKFEKNKNLHNKQKGSFSKDQNKLQIKTKTKTKTKTTKGERKSERFHVVKPRETLRSISLRYNIHEAEIRRINKLNNKQLYPGQNIVLPMEEKLKPKLGAKESFKTKKHVSNNNKYRTYSMPMVHNMDQKENQKGIHAKHNSAKNKNGKMKRGFQSNYFPDQGNCLKEKMRYIVGNKSLDGCLTLTNEYVVFRPINIKSRATKQENDLYHSPQFWLDIPFKTISDTIIIETDLKSDLSGVDKYQKKKTNKNTKTNKNPNPNINKNKNKNKNKNNNKNMNMNKNQNNNLEKSENNQNNKNTTEKEIEKNPNLALTKALFIHVKTIEMGIFVGTVPGMKKIRDQILEYLKKRNIPRNIEELKTQLSKVLEGTKSLPKKKRSNNNNKNKTKVSVNKNTIDSESDSSDSDSGSSGSSSEEDNLMIMKKNQTYDENFKVKFFGTTRILTQDRIQLIRKELPFRLTNSNLKLIYSTYTHGMSTNTFYRKVSQANDTLLLIRNHKNEILGAYSAVKYERSSRHYYGSGEMFLFTFYPKFQSFHWTQKNNFFLLTDDFSFTFGAGSNCGLWFDSEFTNSSSYKSETFDNEPLASTTDFRIIDLEIWGFNR